MDKETEHAVTEIKRMNRNFNIKLGLEFIVLGIYFYWALGVIVPLFLTNIGLALILLVSLSLLGFGLFLFLSLIVFWSR
jgi:hypothetical protein